MSLLDSTAGGIVLPEQIGPHIIQPLRALSTALQVHQRRNRRPEIPAPAVDLDDASTWLTECADITETDPTIGEEVVTAMKLERNIFGIPLNSLSEGIIADGVVWALDRDNVYAVIRQDIGLMADPSF